MMNRMFGRSSALRDSTDTAARTRKLTAAGSVIPDRLPCGLDRREAPVHLAAAGEGTNG